ncbi:hypothetical protein C8R47DRAFT_1202224 [Mycena vitilis]|nr:hypothetical protein C8R47DRAFT_1202224 [Mycena vitilis]
MHTGKEDVEFIFDYCPPKVYCTSDHAVPIPTKNLSFYDRHIDERLLLRRILPMTSLLQTLADATDEALKNVLDSGLPIPDEADESGMGFEMAREYAEDHSIEPIAGCHGVSRHYKTKAFAFFHPTASLLLMRPLTFNSIFQWNSHEREEHWEPHAHGIPFVLNGHALTIKRRRSALSIVPRVLHHFDAETQDRLQGVVKHVPVLGTWQIYPPSLEGNKVLEDMGRIVLSESFTPGICTTVGFQPSRSCCAPSHDANRGIWTTPPHTKRKALDVTASLLALRGQPLATPRRSARLGNTPGPSGSRSTRTQNPVRVRHEEPRITPAIPALSATDRWTEEFLQHGWNESVIEDSTFIVFTNGVFERIGIRHRGTQTLFLSDLMSVSRCNPSYGRVHIGLFVISKGSAAKRGNPEVDQTRRPSARQRTEDTQSTTERLFTAASSRNLLLVRLVYGIYNSVTPASFIRSGPTLLSFVFPQTPRKTRPSYAPTEYATVTLGPEFTSGATGTIHEGVFEVQAKDGQVLTGNVVVKVALYPDQQARMRHEFSVYERLAAATGKAIPAILGIYEDIEGSASLMVMNNCGRSLSQTRLMEDKINVRVSETEKAAFLAVLALIHTAGVEHRDIRPPNLLLNDAGEAVIIDFDQAELDPSEIRLRREIVRFKKLLDGELTSADAL